MGKWGGGGVWPGKSRVLWALWADMRVLFGAHKTHRCINSYFKRFIGVLVTLQKNLLLNRAFETFLCACGTGLATYSHYSRQAQLWIRILYFPMAVSDPDPTGKLGKVN